MDGQSYPDDSTDHPAGGIIADFFHSLDNFLAEASPAHKQLSDDSEKMLSRYCYALALFEEVFRAPAPAVQNSILFREEYRSADELLQAIPSQWVDDLAALSELFFHRFESHLGEEVTLNPKFEGGADIDGADGDRILIRCLVDCKTTINLLPI